MKKQNFKNEKYIIIDKVCGSEEPNLFLLLVKLDDKKTGTSQKKETHRINAKTGDSTMKERKWMHPFVPPWSKLMTPVVFTDNLRSRYPPKEATTNM